MGDEVKKISFGFSKLVKKPSIVSNKLNQVKPDENKVEFIDCLESKSIKLKDPEPCKDSVLVIPLKRQPEEISSVKHDIERDIVKTSDSTLRPNIQEDKIECSTSVESGKDKNVSSDTSASSLSSTKPKCENLTLDEIAAREILEDLNKQNVKEEARIFSVPLSSNAPTGEKESSLDDYESIPVNAFGMAMLRGMGWAPGKGIGKNEQLVTPSMPTLRPKGMGLGADKVIKPIADNAVNNDLKMTKGSFIRVIAGTHKNLYGHIEGFDDESGRLIVKLALQKESVSLNEFMIQLVDEKEYVKNSKVINVSKYEQYKNDECKKNVNEISAKELSNEDELRKESIFVDKSSKIRKSEISRSSDRGSSSSDYERSKRRTKKKKPSSHKLKSRSRSRSPRKHSKHKKHKKTK